MPFGFCNSPATFQRFINEIFRPLYQRKMVAIYLDDIIILAADEEQALRNLETVLRLAEEYGLEINWTKCQFLSRKIQYLGYEIEDGSLRPNMNKVQAVLRYPEPADANQIQKFLGLAGYFRKFIIDYSIIAKPLSDILKKKNVFKFGAEERVAMETLKRRLAEGPVLKIFRDGLETELHTDASKYGLGAILLQKEAADGKLHPVYYYSKKTTECEQRYSSYELEILAVIMALKKFRNYLLGNKFKIVTDCAAFKMTLSKADVTNRIARWALVLEEYDYSIEHRPGERLKHVDALSRSPVMTIVEEGIKARIESAQRKDEECLKILKEMEEGAADDYSARNGVLYKFEEGNDKLVVPKGLQTEVIRKCHEFGHFGSKKIKAMVTADYYIPKLEKKIRSVIENCVPCIMVSAKAGKKECLLNPIEKDGGPLDTFHLDHLGPLPSTHKNYKYILAIVDGFTKYVWLFPTKTTNSKEVIDKMETIKRIFGNPNRVITDRGAAFRSNEFEKYLEDENIKHCLIATGVPRGNGQVERMHQVVIASLSKLSVESPMEWHKHVNDVQRFLNATYQRSIDTTPFELLVGAKMRNKEDARLIEVLEEENRRAFQEQSEDMRSVAKKQIAKVQEENRKEYDRKHKKAQLYRMDDIVAIKRTQFGPGLKMYPKYLGPYRVSVVKPKDRYEVVHVGSGEGPRTTTVSADLMKPWVNQWSSSEDSGDEGDDAADERIVPRPESKKSETDLTQDGRVVGLRPTPLYNLRPRGMDGRGDRGVAGQTSK